MGVARRGRVLSSVELVVEYQCHWKVIDLRVSREVNRKVLTRSKSISRSTQIVRCVRANAIGRDAGGDAVR